ncbi:hypothetical protein GOX01_22450 [Gluconobacter oxydans]|nr:hypothetical protein GOX01_22450 [Gluconobacter oxydans]
MDPAAFPQKDAVIADCIVLSFFHAESFMTTQTGKSLQTPFEHEIAEHLVDVLQLELAPQEIVPDEPLFGEGLGLDSIDALEVALMISRVYNVTLRSDDPDSRRIFSSLRALASHVAEMRESSGLAGSGREG